jgi:hypothetical protein
MNNELFLLEIDAKIILISAKKEFFEMNIYYIFMNINTKCMHCKICSLR